MPATVVVGAQFGDEGKGKIVDYLADRADVVVRFQGGANAGHTVQVGEQLYAFHLLPSGVLRKRSMNVIGNGVVIDPAQLLKEIEETRAHGHSVENLRISGRPHVVMPYHKIIDGLEEKLKGSLGAGTTLRGIGPSFEDKVRRFGIRMCDLVDPVALREKLETMVPIKQRLIDAYGGTERLDLEAIYKEEVEYGARLAPFVADTSVWLDAAIRRRKRMLFEGAQGTHLCIDHGIYPFGTSSDCVAGAASVGAGVGPQFLTDIVGVAKAFTSRVGTGPFPTEVEGDTAEYLRERGGGEYGTTTRRPRRVGWLDLVMLRMAVRVNGLVSLAVTKLDVLGGLDRIPVCVSYRFDGEAVKEFPASMRVLSRCEPVYREFKGWPDLTESAWIATAQKGKRALPEAMRDVPEPAALGPLRIRTRRVVEFDAAQEGVQIDLFLRDHSEGLDPRHEAGLARLVRAHASELLDVPAGDVHEDRLGRVVEVQARGDVSRVDLAGRAVEGLPTKRTAVAARDRLRIDGDDFVHRMPHGVRIGQHAVLDSKSGAEPPRVVDSLGTVRCDPFIDRHADELDVASVREELREERGGRARVLPAAHPDRDPLSTEEVDLGSELALHPPLDEIEEMRTAQVLPAVPEPLDGRGATSVARHGRSNRRRGLRPHGPGGGPEGGDGSACAAPGGGAMPATYGGAAPK